MTRPGPSSRDPARSAAPFSLGSHRAAMMSKPNRLDVVFIRKSTKAQDEQGQKATVKTMLAEAGIAVPDKHWFVCTVPRPKVQANAEFGRLMELVEADKVGTVFLESQDRFGTGGVKELFTLLGKLAEHDTRLY